MGKGKRSEKDELYKYFKHMEDEDKKSLLGGMAWDDICWHIHDAVKSGITKNQLAQDFPWLLGYLVDD